MANRVTGRQLGLAALAMYLLLPDAVVFLLIGIAVSWWVAAAVVAALTGFVFVIYVASRSAGILGEAFGTAGWDPLDCAQWTR